jgi:hypothetical protein
MTWPLEPASGAVPVCTGSPMFTAASFGAMRRLVKAVDSRPVPKWKEDHLIGFD